MLDELLKFNTIFIQCHDNPDADAIASGYAMMRFFEQHGKNVKFFYSGRNIIRKSNLVLMINELHIPIQYYNPERSSERMEGLLLTVDCQYGAGNVTRFDADYIAVIDHHQVECDDIELSVILPSFGSCSTLIWDMLRRKNSDVAEDENVGTALYYGLFTDTNQFAELHNPIDRDAMDSLKHNQRQITMFKNANISFDELKVAGDAMQGYHYDEAKKYTIVFSQPCDPNILGLISDFFLQVDTVETCVVFNENNDGYKLSVRSCVREVNAKELVEFLCEEIGSGGGHFEKAGGFISKKLFSAQYSGMEIETYIRKRMDEYCDKYEIIYASKSEPDVSGMKQYQKKKIPIGYVKASEILPIGTPITVRSLEGDFDLFVEEDLYIMIGVKGEVYINSRKKFENSYIKEDIPYVFEECALSCEYTPKIKNRLDGTNLLLTDYAKRCIPAGVVKILAKPLEKHVKIFPVWDDDHYMTGRPGDYVAVRSDDNHDIYIIENEIFGKTYEAIEI